MNNKTIGYKKFFNTNLFLFLFFFALLLISYVRLPISGSFPGNHDTWGNLSMFLELESKWNDFFNHLVSGTFLYPYEHPWISYGLDFFTGAIWVFFHKIGCSLIWSYWLYLTTILASNSLGLYIFSHHFIQQKAIRFAIALIFSLHVIVYANIDTPNVLSYFFYFLSLHYLFLFFNTHTFKNIFLFSAFSGIQLYASPTNFIFLFFSSLCFVLIEEKKLVIKHIRYYLISILFVLIFMTPFLVEYIYQLQGNNSLEYLNVSQTLIDKYLSLQWQDFFKIHPAHVLSTNEGLWEQNIGHLKDASPGIFLLILIFLSLLFSNARKVLIVMFVLFLIGSGRTVFLSDTVHFRNPIDLIFSSINFYNLFRIPSRTSVVIFIYCLIVSGIFLDKAFYRFKKRNLIIFSILCILLIETTSWSAKTYPSDKIIAAYTSMNKTLNQEKDKYKIILNLPSGLFSETKDSREFKYVINRFYQQNTILNGSTAYLPQSRLELNELLNSTDFNSDSLCSYLSRQKVDAVLLFKNFVKDKTDENQISVALNCDCLTIKREENEIVLLSVETQ